VEADEVEKEQETELTVAEAREAREGAVKVERPFKPALATEEESELDAEKRAKKEEDGSCEEEERA
jgi:hypothetical protein